MNMIKVTTKNSVLPNFLRKNFGFESIGQFQLFYTLLSNFNLGDLGITLENLVNVTKSSIGTTSFM
jgi:hypothetical protein